LGEILVDLEAERALSGDELRIVEGVNVGVAALGDELLGLLVRVVPDLPVQHDLGAVGLRRGDFRRRRVLRHAHDGMNAVNLRGERDTLRMIAGRRTDHAAALLLLRQIRELVERAADLVRAGLLEDLRFQPDVEAGPLAEDPRGEERRLVDVARDDGAGALEVGAGEAGHRLNRESSSPAGVFEAAAGTPLSMNTIE